MFFFIFSVHETHAIIKQDKKSHQVSIFSVHETHAIIKQDKKSHQVFIKPSEKDCRLLVNGDLITSEVYYLLITSMVLVELSSFITSIF